MRRPVSVLHPERGFTLIELMIVVAVIAILAAVVVPSLMRDANKTWARSEANAVIGELSTKLDQYKSDYGAFTNATTLQHTAPVTCPPSPTKAGVDAASTCGTGAWADLRVAAPQAKLRCAYAIQVGDAGDSFIGALPPGITFTPPPTIGWYAIIATCDSDSQGPPNAQYFRSSVDTSLLAANEGK